MLDFHVRSNMAAMDSTAPPHSVWPWLLLFGNINPSPARRHSLVHTVMLALALTRERQRHATLHSNIESLVPPPNYARAVTAFQPGAAGHSEHAWDEPEYWPHVQQRHASSVFYSAEGSALSDTAGQADAERDGHSPLGPFECLSS
jgi:hypothetical protein